MKRADLITILIVAAVICGFAFIPGAWVWFNTTTANHGLLMSFFKFALLGTFGEMLALRIREGVYMKKGFGLLPKLLIWGILGVVIASAMTIFKTGTVKLLDGGFHLMNTLFDTVFMSFHKITDIHIAETGGTLRGFFSKPLEMRKTLSEKINWDIQYGFVFAKTIPLFWYPAHTITFLLPPTLQVLFAAFLGVVLGVLLSIKK